jgi:hypothetical protein
VLSSSPLSFMRINSPTTRQFRVEQLRKEESVDERTREAEQDREVTSQIHLNQSCNDLKIDDEDYRSESNDMMMDTLPCPTTLPTPFIVPLSPVYSSRVRSRSLTPTSPSSSRTFSSYRRSLSPVPMRPSSLCFEPRKRKRNSELEEMDTSPTHLHPPAKRSVFVSPLTTTSPPLISHYNHTLDQTRPAFSTHLTPSLSPTSLVPRPYPAPYYDSAPFLNTRKRVNIPGRLTLNSHGPQEDSAFLPFKQTLAQPNDQEQFLPPPPSILPVTTIS